MTSFAERLSWARGNAGYSSPQAAAEAFGWNANTYKSHDNGIRGGARGPNEATVRKYARAFGVDWVWLLTGQGKSPSKRAVVSSYDPDAPEAPLDPDAAPDGSAVPPDGIRELANKGGMGAGQTISTSYIRGKDEIKTQDAILDDYWRIPPPFVRGVLHTTVANLLVVECEGDSMKPTLEPNDRVVVNTAHKKLSPDGLYAIRNRYEDVVIKRLTLVESDPPRVQVVSDNPNHKMQEYALDEVAIVGKVVMGLKLF